MVGLLTWLLFRRRPAFCFGGGCAWAGAGPAVIMGADLAKHTNFGLGDIFALAAAACFAVYLIATEEIRSHTTTLEFLRLAILSSTIFMFVFTLILRTPLIVPDRRTFLALLGLGLVSQLGGYLALTFALGHLPPTLTSFHLLSQGPLIAMPAAMRLVGTLIGSELHAR